MKKYRILVHGRNLLTKADGAQKRFGFYTNVFVEAFGAAEAESLAIDLLREDAGLKEIVMNADDDPVVLTADEIQQAESFEGFQLPRTGLALYSESGEQ